MKPRWAAFLLLFVSLTFADNQFLVRSKDNVQQISMPAPVPSAGAGRTLEGPSSSDFNASDPYRLIAPEIAVGPDDILTIVNRTIARYPNPNAPGLSIPSNNPVIPSVLLPGEKTNLDQWLGPNAMAQLCPTSPRTALTCVMDNASVRYDQMQGRFVVLFTVTDSGLVGGQVRQPRKASWVLAASRYATLTGTDGTGAFTTPVSPTPGGAAFGGSNWVTYYGNSLNGLGTDGFGNPPGAGSVGVGNINALPGIPGSQNRFDCSPQAIAPATTPFTAPTSACYFPSSARLGIDNDDIVITSSVYNSNFTYDPNTVAGKASGNTAFSGTRVRIIKKAALYTGQPFTAGNQFAANGFGVRAAGSYHDLFTNVLGNGVPIAQQPFTLAVDPRAPTTPVFWEPAQTRGRPEASFSNNRFSTTLSSSQTYLVGTESSSQITDFDYVQAIRKIYPAFSQYASLGIAGPFGALPYYPVLQGGTTNGVDGAPASGVPQPAFGGLIESPSPAAQAPRKSGSPAAPLYVGDSRPQRVLFREGHLYDAHTIDPFSGLVGPTVSYNIIQKLTADLSAMNSLPITVLSTEWGNGAFYAPMYDVPANVNFSGPSSPVNLLPILEKLFVGTTFPPFSGPAQNSADPGYLEAETGNPVSGPGGRDVCSGNAVAYPSLFQVRCGEDAYDVKVQVRDPGTGAIFTQNGKPGGAPSLLNAFGIRGGASTDPNDGSLWIFGQYARRDMNGVGQWGTYAANDPLSFPATDPYGRPAVTFDDVPPAHPAFPYVQIGRINGIAAPDPGIGPNSYGPDAPVTRSEMAAEIIRSLMDESAINDFLNATGGQSLSSNADVSPGSPNFRYIEVMSRHALVAGCQDAGDPARRFCPGDPVTRGQVAVSIIRAKMNNIFPSVVAGCPAGFAIPQCSTAGDNFGLFVPSTPYFSDNPVPTPDAPNPLYPYIQKMRELGICRGVDVGTINGSDQIPTNGVFNPGDVLTRGELMTFLVRAFFP